MTDSSLKERRIHERHDRSINLHGTPDGGGVVARMVAQNLSLGGLYCTSTRDFPEMTRLAVRLMLPLRDGTNGEAEPLDVEATVVRREKLAPATNGDERFEFALFFTRVDEAGREQLRRFLEP